MKNLVIVFISSFFLSGCLQTENSSSTDGGPNLTGTPEFIAAVTVMAAKCTSCHYHDYHTKTEQQLLDQGLVVPGDPENSLIYYRLTGSAGPGGPKNMPQDVALTAGELATMVTWINSIPL